MGKNTLRLLLFAIKYQGWNSYGTDRQTVDALRRLENLGLVERDQKARQFRLIGQDRYTQGYADGYAEGIVAGADGFISAEPAMANSVSVP